MSKGLSGVIVIIIILIISISLAGGFYLWINTSTSSLKDTAEGFAETESNSNSAIAITTVESTGGTSDIVVRNTGRTVLNSSSFQVFVNGAPEDSSKSSDESIPSQSISLSVSKTLEMCDRVRVTGEDGIIDEYIYEDDGTCVTGPGPDTEAPETLIDSGPSGTVANRDATFTYSCTDAEESFPCQFQYRLEGGSWSAWSISNTNTYSGLSDGIHLFEVLAKDAAENPDLTPAARSWKIDSTGPSTSIVSGPSGTTQSRSATFTVSCSDSLSSYPCQYRYRLDGGAWTSWTASDTKSYNGLSYATHTFNAQSRDSLNNEGTIASRTWTVQNHPPSVSVSGPSGVTSNANPTFGFSCTDPEGQYPCQYRHRVVVDYWSTKTSSNTAWTSWSISTSGQYNLRNGGFTLEVQGRDSTGRESSVAKRHFEIVTGQLWATASHPGYQYCSGPGCLRATVGGSGIAGAGFYVQRNGANIWNCQWTAPPNGWSWAWSECKFWGSGTYQYFSTMNSNSLGTTRSNTITIVI